MIRRPPISTLFPYTPLVRSLIGVFNVEGDEQQPVDTRDLAFGEALATALASSIERATLHQEVERQARTDQVTGLPNRQVFQDRKSTRLNSSHANISYAVFCL